MCFWRKKKKSVVQEKKADVAIEKKEEVKPQEVEKKPVEEIVKKENTKTVKADTKKVPSKESNMETNVDKEVKSESKKMYHVSKRATDNKWVVKFAGGEKAIKLFDTKVEALAYADKLAENQDAGVHVHASKGKYKGKIRS